MDIKVNVAAESGKISKEDLLMAIEKLKENNVSAPYYFLWNSDTKEIAENLFNVKLDLNDKIEKGIRFIKIQDF